MTELYKCYKIYNETLSKDTFFIVFARISSLQWDCIVATIGVDFNEWKISAGRGYTEGELSDTPDKHGILIEIFSTLKNLPD